MGTPKLDRLLQGNSENQKWHEKYRGAPDDFENLLIPSGFIKHGLLEHGPLETGYFSIFLLKPPSVEAFTLPCLITGGYKEVRNLRFVSS